MKNFKIAGYYFYSQDQVYLTDPHNKNFYEGAKDVVQKTLDDLGVKATVTQSNKAKHGYYITTLNIRFEDEVNALLQLEAITV